MFTSQVAIGPEFFAKARNDYRDWRWAIARELNTLRAAHVERICPKAGYVHGSAQCERCGARQEQEQAATPTT